VRQKKEEKWEREERGALLRGTRWNRPCLDGRWKKVWKRETGRKNVEGTLKLGEDYDIR